MKVLTTNDGGSNIELVTTQGNIQAEQLEPAAIVAAGGESIVWRPAEPAPGGNVFATFQSLAPVLAATKGKRTLVVDPSLAPAVVPAGDWDVDCTAVVAGFPSELAVISFAEGAHWHWTTLSLERIVTETQGSTSVSTPPANAFLTLLNSRLQNTANAAPFLHCLTSAVIVAAHSGALASGNPIVAVNAAATFIAIALDGSQIDPHSIVQGDALGGSVQIQFDGASQTFVSATQVPAPTMINFDPRTTFVLSPTSTSSAANVFTTWGALAAAMKLCPGPKAIYCAEAVAHVTAGTWDVDLCTFYGNQSLASCALVFDDGAHWTFNAAFAETFLILKGTGTTSVFTDTVGGFSILFLRDGASVVCQAGAAPFAHATQSFAFALQVETESQVGDGVHNVVTVDAGKSFSITGFTFCTVNAHAVGGAGTVAFSFDDSARMNVTQDSLTTFATLSDASREGYTPAVPGNWVAPAPTRVQQALDRIAANVLNAHPIP